MVSGLFDLRPLRYGNMQPQLQIDDGVIQRNSPLFHLRATPTPALITWGGEESAEFHRQSERFLQGWKAVGNQARARALSEANHFTAIFGFEDPDSLLCQWILQATNTPLRGDAAKPS